MIVVQSMDGKMQVFEQSAHSFTRQFVDCLIPGPMAYLPRMDSILNCNYAARVECYKYQLLASLQNEVQHKAMADAAESKDNRKSGSGATIGFGLLAVKSALVEWSLNIGENIRQVIVSNFTGSPATAANKARNDEILLLCDNSMYILKVRLIE